MITFDKNNKIFHITNNDISYYIYINNTGYLETLYFGKHLSSLYNIDGIRKANVDNCSTQYYSLKNQKEYTFEDHFRNGIARSEISPHGLNDKRGAPIVIRKNNGSFETNFKYFKHLIYKDIIPLNDMPHAHSNGNAETLEIILKEEKYDIYLHLFITIFNDKNIIVKNFSIENKTNEEYIITRALSMQLDLPTDQYDVHHFRGRWEKERDWITNRLHDGVQEISSNYGRSSHEENPFVFISEVGSNMDNGEVIGFNLIYSGNFLFRIFNDAFKSTHITYGINDEDFEWILGPSETFKTPQAVISYSYSGIETMSHNFHRFIKENLITYKHDNEIKPILFNSWEGCYFNFTTDSIISYINDSKKIGAELFVLDDGWFGERNDDYTSLGDWYINDNKIDLKKVISECHKNGMKFGIWFEAEMVNPISKLYKEHPEYILGEENCNTLSISRHQFHLDFSNPNVVDNIYNQMIKIIDNYKIDYIKWDYNRVVMEHYSRHFESKRQGEIYHRLVLGYYDLINRLTKRYPDIMFEGCASGGGRFDLGTLFYTPQIWCSDENNPIQRTFIQYNTSLGYPLSSIGSHVNANPITPYRTKAMIALFGTYGYEMNPNKLTEDEIYEVNKFAGLYHKYHKEIIEDGTLYHLLSPTHTNYMSMQCVSKDKSKSMLIWINHLKEGDCYRFLKLKGLDENKLYSNTFDGNTYSGKYYMNVGINLSRIWANEFTCQLIILEEY